MIFLQPAFLWGLLAMAIPVLIHLWHQKRGQPLPWAAMQWLREVSEQQQRGLKFDDWLLLAVRCLLIALLSILLAKPVWPTDANTASIRTAHLAVADSLVTRSFRFELDQARQRNETVILLPSSGPVDPLQLQARIDSLNRPDVALHLYTPDNASLADVPLITVPERFTLHPASTQPAAKLVSKPFTSIKSPINVRLDYRNPLERKTVLAALRALAGVYGLTFNIDGLAEANSQPDWILTDKLPPSQAAKPASTLYTVSGITALPQPVPNVVATPDTLTPQTSERVANGQLPEWLGEQLLQFYKLAPPAPALTQQELAGLFVRTKVSNVNQSAVASRTTEQNWLLMVLIVMIGVERWLALRK